MQGSVVEWILRGCLVLVKLHSVFAAERLPGASNAGERAYCQLLEPVNFVR